MSPESNFRKVIETRIGEGSENRMGEIDPFQQRISVTGRLVNVRRKFSGKRLPVDANGGGLLGLIEWFVPYPQEMSSRIEEGTSGLRVGFG